MSEPDKKGGDAVNTEETFSMPPNTEGPDGPISVRVPAKEQPRKMIRLRFGDRDLQHGDVIVMRRADPPKE